METARGALVDLVARWGAGGVEGVGVLGRFGWGAGGVEVLGRFWWSAPEGWGWGC